jgi:hypothetical protein
MKEYWNNDAGVSLYCTLYITNTKLLNCSSRRVIVILLFVRSYDYIMMMGMSRFPSDLVFKQVYIQLKINLHNYSHPLKRRQITNAVANNIQSYTTFIIMSLSSLWINEWEFEQRAAAEKLSTFPLHISK